MTTGKRLLIGLCLAVCLGLAGMVAGGLAATLLVTGTGFDGLADTLGFLFGGTFLGVLSALVLALTLSPHRLMGVFKAALVASALSALYIVYRVVTERPASEPPATRSPSAPVDLPDSTVAL